MAQEFASLGIVEVDGQEIDLTKLDVRTVTGRKPVKTINRKGRVKGFAKGIVEYTLSITVAVPLNSPEPDWDNVTDAKISVEEENGKRIMKTRLKLGVLYNGTLHHDVLVKILTVGGECQALEVINDLGLSEKETLSTAEQMLVDLAYLAQQVEFDGIPREAVTPAFLLDNLATDDYVLINNEINQLRKKRMGVSEDQKTANEA